MAIITQRLLGPWIFLVLALAASLAHAVTPKIAGGYYHAIMLKADGSVWSLGDNTFGQLGDGSDFGKRNLARRVPNLAGVMDIAAGADHSLAVRKNGTVVAWGSNSYGQLGDGSQIDRGNPSPVAGLNGVVAVAAAPLHSLALKGDGTVWAWGDNQYGQLGDGTNLTRLTPVTVSGLSHVVAIAAGSQFNLALKSDGTVWAWGANDFGQLGDNSTLPRQAPVQVSGLSGVTAIGAGFAHSVALRSNGTVWTWGNDNYGQLGSGAISAGNRLVPGVVSTLSGVTAIRAGTYHVLALRTDGTVLSWGGNDSGQLGLGNTTNTATPTAISLAAGAIAIGAGAESGFVIRRDGSVRGWGDNHLGVLGDGTFQSPRTSPTTMLRTQGYVAIAAGSAHSLALKDDGSVWAWGANSDGQLGRGTTGGTGNNPARVTGLTGVVAIAAGSFHSLAVKRDGTVWTWGQNTSGQLGDGSVTSRNVPVQVTGVQYVVAVAAGAEHSVALKHDGTVWSWGFNGNGQLGDGSFTSRYSPVAANLPGLPWVSSIACGFHHTLAASRGGQIYAWGANSFGQLGDNSTTDRAVPVNVTSGNSVAAGAYHSLATIYDGTVLAWGLNLYGQLGDGTTTQRNSPVSLAASVNTAQEIAAGGFHSAARDADGSLLAWGKGGSGELGNGGWNNVPTPTGVTSPRWGSTLAAGANHGLGVLTDGSLVAWGDNSFGQLGDGTRTWRNTPTVINDAFPSNDGDMPIGWVATGGSAAAWTVASSDGFYAGPWSIKSGAIGHGAHSGIQVAGNFRDGFVSFQRKVSSEASGDYLRFYVDGVKQDEWAGESGWLRAGAFLKAGNHTIAWKYEKNGSGSVGLDAAWIDSVELPTAFTDVPTSNFAFDYIHAIKDAGITTGCGGSNYCPNQNVTREQMAAFIIRAVEGEPAACVAAPFSDVPTSNSFCKYIKRMQDLAITTGCGAGNYCPSQNVTRDQMAAFIIRAIEGEPVGCVATQFADVPAGSTFCRYIKRMSELGITTGCGGSNYCPSQLVTRDQMAAFLGRAFLGM